MSNLFTRVMPELREFLNDFKDKTKDKAADLRSGYYRYKWKIQSIWQDRCVDYVKYFVKELTPYVALYGLALNIPLHVLMDMDLTVQTVLSWGLVFYFISEELTDIANELKPYIRVSAKVDK